MLKKDITFTDPWTNEKTTRAFWFHMTEAELLRLINTHKGDLVVEMQRVSDGQAEPKEIIALFEEFISKSYGERTDDGRFLKNKDIVDSFLVSEPYSALIMSFFTEEGGADAAAFLNGLMPADLVAKVNAQNEKTTPSDQPSAERTAELRARLTAGAVDGISRPTPPIVQPEV